jgi:hypothetical protein
MAKGRYDPNWKPPRPPYAGVCAALLAGKQLSQKETEFVEQIAGFLKLSPARQRWLDIIVKRTTRDKPPARRRRRGFADELDDTIPW